MILGFTQSPQKRLQVTVRPLLSPYTTAEFDTALCASWVYSEMLGTGAGMGNAFAKMGQPQVVDCTGIYSPSDICLATTTQRCGKYAEDRVAHACVPSFPPLLRVEIFILREPK